MKTKEVKITNNTNRCNDQSQMLIKYHTEFLQMKHKKTPAAGLSEGRAASDACANERDDATTATTDSTGT